MHPSSLSVCAVKMRRLSFVVASAALVQTSMAFVAPALPVSRPTGE